LTEPPAPGKWAVRIRGNADNFDAAAARSQIVTISKPKTFDGCLAALRDDQRAALETRRKLIRAAAPAAEEYVGSGLAAFRVDGKPLVAIGASVKHCAFYLMSGSMVEAHAEELADYDTSKGTVRFAADSPLPAKLVEKLVKARLAENAALAES